MGNLVRNGYPALAGLDEEAFVRLVAPLGESLPDASVGSADGRIPFVVVVGSRLAPPDRAIGLVTLGGKAGFTEMPADDLDRFRPIERVTLPAAAARLVTDVDAGGAFRNITPDDALETILREGRSPLTTDEGMALVTHVPGILKERNAFSMLGSRCGDRRVTAMWISRGRPRLGWCWAGNPHRWLGSASCGGRIAA